MSGVVLQPENSHSARAASATELPLFTDVSMPPNQMTGFDLARSCAAAWHAGVERMFFNEAWSETPFCTEVPLFHEDWPEDLGHVACPVTLIHGKQDGNAPFETARDYCTMHPGWHLVAWPDEGELVAHVHWREVLDLIEQAWTPVLLPAPEG